MDIHLKAIQNLIFISLFYLGSHKFQQTSIFLRMPVNYLDFLQVVKKNLQFALRDPNLSALLEACKRESETKEFFFSCVSYC